MPFNTLASEESVGKTMEALKGKGYLPELFREKSQVLARINELIPAGASVMNGASRTLQEVGFLDHLMSGAHPWKNLHAAILAEKDPVKQGQLRRQALLSDYYLGSVHALAETGEMVIASNSGSQLPHLVFTSPNLILVISTKKITSTLEEARKRLREHVIPLENERMLGAMGRGTKLNKELIMYGDPDYLGRKIHILLVSEDLGF